DENTRRAIAALRGAELREGLLQRMEPTAFGHALDGRDLGALELGGQRETRQDRRAVDEHRARPAFTELAAVLGADEVEVLAEDFEQRLVDRHQQVVRFAVDREAEANIHGLPAVSPAESFQRLVNR